MSLYAPRLARGVLENGGISTSQTVPGFGKDPVDQYSETTLKTQVEATAREVC